jgi:hypothetical protein
MARLVTEGFEFGSLGTVGTSSGVTAVSTDKYTGTYSAQSTATGNFIDFPITGSSGYLKMSFKMTYASATLQSIFTLLTGTSQQLGLVVNGTNGIITARRATTVLGSASTTGLYLNQWNNLECYYVIDDAVGAVTVKVNGKVIIELTNQDTRNVTGDLTSFRIGYGGTSSYNAAFGFYDDIFLNDTTGAVDNTWLGDRRIQVLVPSGPGSKTELTRSDTGVANWTLVDDIPHDGDTTYVYGTSADLEDFYELTDLPEYIRSSTIHAVTPVAYAKTDVLDGTGKARLGVYTDTTEYWGSVDHELTQVYAEYRGNRLTQNPATSAAWQALDIDGLEVGFQTR